MHAPITSPPSSSQLPSRLPFCTHLVHRSSPTRAFSQPLLPHLPSPASVVHFYSMLPPPREHIQFASDAHRDRAEILIDIRSASLLTVNDCDKKKEIVRKSYRLYILSNFFCIRVWNRVHLHRYKSLLGFSCAFCDRFGAINRTASYFEFAYKVSVFLPLEK